MSARRGRLAVVLLGAAALGASPPRGSLTPAECATALDGIARALDERRLDEAAARAAVLEAQDLKVADARLPVDPTLLPELRRAEAAHAPHLARRTRALAAALRTRDAGEERAPDGALLERLRAEADVARGGTIAEPDIRRLEIPPPTEERLNRFAAWLDDAIERLRRWYRSLWPEDRREAQPGGDALGLTFAVVAAAVAGLAVLAVRTVRRHRATPKAKAPEAPSNADEDPLSREPGEWERYAHELAAAGRRREAVRAWYHAVLSTLFRVGRLEPRKGRTNWEHAARLPPDLAWRPSFLEITRCFEREWYGRDSSTGEALAECADLAGAILGAVHAEGLPA
jgi:hypothetical protein